MKWMQSQRIALTWSTSQARKIWAARRKDGLIETDSTSAAVSIRAVASSRFDSEVEEKTKKVSKANGPGSIVICLRHARVSKEVCRVEGNQKRIKRLRR